MKNQTENSNEAVKKKGRKHKKGLFDKSIKYTEKILLPLAVIFLTFQYIFLTNKLDEAQETISQISFTDYFEESNEKHATDYVNLNSMGQSIGESVQSNSTANTMERPALDLDESELAISSAFDMDADIAEPVDYFSQESDKISKYFSSYRAQKNESAINIVDNKNFAEAQQAIADLISKVSDKTYNGDRDQLKAEFWKLYWNDKLSYDNSNFEYLVLKFGKQLNLDDTNFSNLRAISTKIQAELGNKPRNTFWVEDELNNLRIN